MSNMLETKLKIGSEKNFGIVFGSFFLILTVYLIIFHDYFNLITITLSIIFFLASFTKPIIFKYPNLLWFYLGILLGKFFVPIFLFFTYFIIFTPMGFLVKLFKRNYINKNIDNKLASYWIKRDTEVGSLDDQF
jgi:hypothetical protein